jgi:hypothetical protein
MTCLNVTDLYKCYYVAKSGWNKYDTIQYNTEP